MANGNTTGKVVGETPSANVNAQGANPQVEEKEGLGTKILDGTQWVLDAAGLIPVIGEPADLVNAGISAARGDFVGAGLSIGAMVPVAGWGATGAKVGIKGSKAVGKKAEKEALEKAAKEKAEKEAAEKAAKEKAEKEAKEKAEKEAKEKAEKEAAEKAKKDGDSQVKKKKKMKCGEYGKYGKLKQKTGDGKFDRDHIPSKAALKKRAEQLNRGDLSAAQKKAIDNWGNSIAVPRQAHIDVSPTYGQSAAEAAKDAKDLAGSARRDVESMLKKIDEYDADGGCKKAYQKAAKRVLKDNKWFDDQIQKILKAVK